MIVRTVADLQGTDRHISKPNWSSTRLIVADDHMGFSMHVTRIFPGQTGLTEYADHLEAAYCITGHATLVFESGRTRVEINPGSVYALDAHDPHTMIVHNELLLVCVFSPPLKAAENANDRFRDTRAAP
ncbi:MAG: ectoine synthase [Paracoccaceae bacterium]